MTGTGVQERGFVAGRAVRRVAMTNILLGAEEMISDYRINRPVSFRLSFLIEEMDDAA